VTEKIKNIFSPKPVNPPPSAKEEDGGGTKASPETTIGKKEIEYAGRLLNEYVMAKRPTDNRILNEEEWFRLRHVPADPVNPKTAYEGETVPNDNGTMKQASSLLLNSVRNKHADSMDNQPRVNILPRQEDDEDEAAVLTAIMPSILAQARFEQVYDDAMWSKIKHGVAAFHVFWNAKADGGLGSVGIKKVNLLNLFWEPEAEDIQDSENVFYVRKMSIAKIKRNYPNVNVDELNTNADTAEEYDDNPKRQMTTKADVVDWYYKIERDGKTILHFAQFVGTQLIYATENDPEMAERGLYDHGKYPFIFDVNIPLEGQPIGFGEIACGKGKQEWVDVLWNKIMENTEWSATARYFAELGSKVNLKDFCDPKKKIVEYTGTPDGLVRIETEPIHGSILQILDMLKDELKETTGARDAATGGTSGGVTAAQGIAIMSENSGKTSRDSNRGSYRAFAEVIEMVIELIRQFFDKPHYYRFSGEGYQGFIRYKNDGLNYQRVRNENDIVSNGEARHPLFDLEITVEKNSTYTRLQQNQLVLQLYSAGFFNPQNSASSLTALEMMDFDKKNEMLRKVRENDSRQQLMLSIARENVQISAELDRKNAEDGITTNFAAQAQQKLAYIQQAMGAVKGASAPPSEPVNTTAGVQESSAITKTKERVAQSTSAT
jgi:hypothetical protein